MKEQCSGTSENGWSHGEAESLRMRETDKDAFELLVTFLGGATVCPGMFPF